MSLPQTADEDITTSKAARLLGVSQRTVHYWMDRGVIKAWKTAGGHFRIPMSSINQLLAKRQEELLQCDQPILTILLVEDDDILRDVAGGVIADWKLPVRLVVAENGYQGLIQAGLNKPAIVITDLVMPGMDGFQMIRNLLKEPSLDILRIVVITGLSVQQIAAKGGVPDDIRILHKPIPYDQLKAIVLEVLYRR